MGSIYLLSNYLHSQKIVLYEMLMSCNVFQTYLMINEELMI